MATATDPILRLLRLDETDAAAHLHLTAGPLIPGYDLSLHSEAEHEAFYREQVFVEGPIWGAFDGTVLLGFIALKPGWIEHMYVDPALHRRGIGKALIGRAQDEQDDLRLWTFQSNAGARRFYERAGFVIVERDDDGSSNEEGQPAICYRWSRQR